MTKFNSAKLQLLLHQPNKKIVKMEDFALAPLPAPLRIFTSKQSNSLGHFSERKDFLKLTLHLISMKPISSSSSPVQGLSTNT